jgi:hypothetical protein
LDVSCRPLVVDDHAYGALAHEGTQRLKHRLMILRRAVHDPFQPIDTAKSHGHFFAGELLEAFGNLIADAQILRTFLLPQELNQRKAGAEQHRGAAERLADGFAEVVFDIGARLRVADFQRQPSHLALR